MAMAVCWLRGRKFCICDKRKKAAPINAASICVKVFARRAPKIRTNVIVSIKPMAAVPSPSEIITG